MNDYMNELRSTTDNSEPQLWREGRFQSVLSLKKCPTAIPKVSYADFFLCPTAIPKVSTEKRSFGDPCAASSKMKLVFCFLALCATLR